MNKFLEMQERGDMIPLSAILEEIPPDDVLLALFPNPERPKKALVDRRGMEVLKLRLAGLPQADIAKEMGITIRQVAYASKKMRNVLCSHVPSYINVDLPKIRRFLGLGQLNKYEAGMITENLDILSSRQRDIWVLFQQGKNKSQISKELGISYSVVAEHIRHIMRRFKEYEQYCAVKEQNLDPVDLPLTRGEVKIIINALEVYEQLLEQEVHRHPKSDWLGKLPYEAKILADLYDRAQKVIWGEVLIPLHFGLS